MGGRAKNGRAGCSNYLLVRLLESAGIELGGEHIVSGQWVGLLLGPHRLLSLSTVRSTAVSSLVSIVTGALTLRGVTPVVLVGGLLSSGGLRSHVDGS